MYVWPVVQLAVRGRPTVGRIVDSDRTCPECKAGLEQFCPNAVYTYNSPDKHLGGVTCGPVGHRGKKGAIAISVPY